jgi:hypothetical protein
MFAESSNDSLSRLTLLVVLLSAVLSFSVLATAQSQEFPTYQVGENQTDRRVPITPRPCLHRGLSAMARSSPPRSQFGLLSCVSPFVNTIRRPAVLIGAAIRHLS